MQDFLWNRVKYRLNLWLTACDNFFNWRPYLTLCYILKKKTNFFLFLKQRSRFWIMFYFFSSFFKIIAFLFLTFPCAVFCCCYFLHSKRSFDRSPLTAAYRDSFRKASDHHNYTDSFGSLHIRLKTQLKSWKHIYPTSRNGSLASISHYLCHPLFLHPPPHTHTHAHA